MQKAIEACGRHVLRVADANDRQAFTRRLQAFVDTQDRLTLLIVQSHIGDGAPHKQDTKEAPGEPLGADEARQAKQFCSRDPGERYAALADEFGGPVACRVEAPATAQQKQQLTALTPKQITSTELARERIESILSHAPGNGAAIGGIKVNTAHGWFAARPSGTESIYKIYAESFINAAHLQRIVAEAQAIIRAAVSPERP